MSLQGEAAQLAAQIAADEQTIVVKRRRLLALTGGGFGANGVRDPEYPCAAFVGGSPTTRGECQTDGHYMCNECELRATCEWCGHRPTQCECGEAGGG